MVLGAGHGLATGAGAGVRIQCVLQPPLVDIVAEAAQAAGIARQVGGELAVRAAREADSLVGTHIHVTRIFQPTADQGVDDLLDQLLVLGLLAEFIPRIPAHGRSERQAVLRGTDFGSRTLRPRCLSGGQ